MYQTSGLKVTAVIHNAYHDTQGHISHYIYSIYSCDANFFQLYTFQRCIFTFRPALHSALRDAVLKTKFLHIPVLISS